MAKINGAKIDLDDVNLSDGQIDHISVRANFRKRKKKSKDSVVKIDSELLKKVDDYINKGENRLKYVNKKQFIDLAVFEKLKREVKK